MSSKLKDTKQFWSAYRSITKKINRIPSVISDEISSATSSLDRATMFNSKFTSYFNHPTVNFSVPSISTISDINRPTLSTIQCNEDDVMEVLGGIRTRTACGPDGITSVMLKKCAPSISKPLSTIFNSSLATGRLPSSWKYSNVVPIFKSGDPEIVDNYRPISLLSLVSKILERIVHNHLLSHILKHNLISDRQFGFRPGSSTQEAILLASRKWHHIMENKSSVACVFF